MIPIDFWLSVGQKVKIKNPYFKNKIGTIVQYYWVTGEYFVKMRNGHVLPFSPSEITKI